MFNTEIVDKDIDGIKRQLRKVWLLFIGRRIMG